MKKLLMTVLSVALAATIAISGTVAYFTDTEEAVNVMTMGKVDIELNDLDKNDKPFVDNNNGLKLYPIVSADATYDKNDANYVEKKISVTNKNDSEEAYIRVALATPTNMEGALHLTLDESNWDEIAVTGNTFTQDGTSYTVKMWQYKDIVAAGATTDELLKGFYLDPQVDWDDESGLYYVKNAAGEKVFIDDLANIVYVPAYAQAVQAEGFASGEAYVKADADAAFTAAGLPTNPWTKDSLGGLPTYVNSLDALEDALAEGGNIMLTADITLPAGEMLKIPEGVNVTLDMGGHAISASNPETEYALNNLGTLTLKNGTVNARGIYNGYDADGNHNSSAKIIVESGTYNAKGTNGGAAIFSYGIAEINGGTFNSVGGYSLNNRAGGTMTVNNGTVTGGIYNEGALTVNDGKIATERGGYTHAIYHAGTTLVVNDGEFSGNGNEVINANSSVATINGGTFTKVEKTSYLLAGSKMVIYGGTFKAHESNPAGHPVRNDVTIKGGTYNYKPTAAAGYTVTDNENGTWTVSATKVGSSSELSSAIAAGKAVELTQNVKFGNAFNSDANINLAGNTFEATGTLNLGNNADLTMTGGSYEANGTYGHVDVRPTTAEGSTLLFEDIDFSYNKLVKTNGSSTNRLGSVVEVCATAADANTDIVFRNCTFDNAQVLFEGLTGTVGTFDATFENCTFNALTSSAPIYVQNYVKGTITLKDCTFNLECTSSTASAVSVSSSSSTKVTVNFEGKNILNAKAATPYTYDASKGETEADSIKVNGTPANIKVISSYGNCTVKGADTWTVSGIAAK